MPALPPGAAAQDPSQPSARELWEAYPLERDGASQRRGRDDGEAALPPGEAPRATATSVASGTRPAPQRSSEDAAPSRLLFGLVGTAAAAALAAWLWTRRRRSAGAAWAAARRDRPPGASARRPAASSASAPPRLLPEPDPSPWRPPDTSRAWRAEIEWNHAADASTFRVVARTPDGTSEAVIGESGPLEWPPSGAEAARALPRAVYAIGDAMTRAGWRSMAAGEQWHAKRFAWEPALGRRQPGDRLPSGRFESVADLDATGQDDAAPARIRAGQPPSMAAGGRPLSNRGSRHEAG